MATINTAVQLASIRSKIDSQQQIIGKLELELQKLILGDSSKTTEELMVEIEDIYDLSVDGSVLGAAMREGLRPFDGEAYEAGTTPDLTVEELDQTTIRQMLYQARALLGELRIEEQHWKIEVDEEKNRRKELGDFAKG